MSRKKKEIYYWACDFETTVWGKEVEEKLGKKQDRTEVWSAADVRLYDETESVTISHSIRDFLDRFFSLPGNNILYFHNLSFDGSFIIDFILREGYIFTTEKDKDMKSMQFKTSISSMGDWYMIKIKKGKKLLEIRNSLKLMPKSLDAIAKSFKTKHQKLDMKYEGLRYAYCEISEEERRYIENDVLVLKEALEKMFDEGHDKLTIGSCCLSEFKSRYSRDDYKRLFPDIRDDFLDESYTRVWNQWDYIHKAYHGGWCYVNPEYAHRVVSIGKVYDVNSLYPSMMHSVSGNRYPYGHGQYHTGKPPGELLIDTNKFIYLRVKCRFKLKERCFPWIHIRGSAYYKANENLYTSDIIKNGVNYRYYYDFEGNIQDTVHELTFTCIDWILFNDTYDIYDLEYLDYIEFWATTGFFDDYINHYFNIKKNEKGFLRELAKLFLNNLYGKFAMSDDSSYKEPYIGEDDVVHFKIIEEHEKQVGYIPIGAAITSYALNFTVRHAMANYDRFCYADTDSIHIQGEEKPNMVVEHPHNLCTWKNECDFDVAYYERQKTYAEHVISQDGKPCEPFLLLKAAGMNKTAKQKFIDEGRPISDLSVGLEMDDCNLKATRIKGGILLQEKTFKIRKSIDKKVNIAYNQ